MQFKHSRKILILFLILIFIIFFLIQIGNPNTKINDKLIQNNHLSSFNLSNSYNSSLEEFIKIYGEQYTTNDIAIIQAMRMMTLNSWQRNKNHKRLKDFTYNPVAYSDSYNAMNYNGICRPPTVSGERIGVWGAMQNSEKYISQLVEDGLSGKGFRWSNRYKNLPHIKKWISSEIGKQYYKKRWENKFNLITLDSIDTITKSTEFDLDIILSIHTEMNDGSNLLGSRFQALKTAESDLINDGKILSQAAPCGRIGEIRHCDRLPYSPFFNATTRSFYPCITADNTINHSDIWEDRLAFNSKYDFVNLGYNEIPVYSKNNPTSSKCEPQINSYKEFESIYSTSDEIKNDWPSLKQKELPESTRKIFSKGMEWLKENGNGKFGIVRNWAAVQQAYKDIDNLILSNKCLKQTPECLACNLPKTKDGRIMWSLWERFENQSVDSSLLYCPRSCFIPEHKFLIAKDDSGNYYDRRSTGQILDPSMNVRECFIEDSNDINHETISSIINNFFNEIQEKNKISENPIRTATRVQQWLNLMHPFTDGNGRTSRKLMDLILETVGLPSPVFHHFFYDSQIKIDDYEKITEEAIYRHIAITDSCTKFLKCAKENDSSLRPDNRSICAQDNQAIESCKNYLNVKKQNGQFDIKIDPCDCGTHWKYEDVRLPQCSDKDLF